MLRWYLALLALIGCSVLHEPTPPLRVRGGWLRGYRQHNHYRYFGVPYAKVHSSNRFQAPLPVPPWDGIFEATDSSVRCPQVMAGMVVGHPDCLTLNIYAPVKRHKLLPVMVYIHGGCFFEGTGSGFLYGGDYFVDHGVVFVGVNYRLSVEGFLCLGIKEAPGNAGLKDQIAALKWIKENIAAFGGDPDNVTLFGESAGAVSTAFMVLSPAAKGLFHKVILQSGSTLAPWATQHDPIETASTLAKSFGYDTTKPYKIYEILSNRTVSELINAIKYSDHKNYVTADTLFVPCVETVIPGVQPVLTSHPVDVIKTGTYNKVPMIIGYNDNEGIYFVGQDYGTRATDVDPMEVLQKDLHFPSEADKNETTLRIKSHYFSGGKDFTSNLIDLYSDVHFKFPSVEESELFAETTDEPIYYYFFKYSGLINMPKVISWFGSTGGASHADELFYLFKPHSVPLPRFLESEMIQRMVTLWTNFAKYSDPTPSHSPLVPLRWRAGSRSSPTALVLDSQVSVAPASTWRPLEALQLWKDIYNKYRRSFNWYGFKKMTYR